MGVFISQALGRKNSSRVGVAESAKNNLRRLKSFQKGAITEIVSARVAPPPIRDDATLPSTERACV